MNTSIVLDRGRMKRIIQDFSFLNYRDLYLNDLYVILRKNRKTIVSIAVCEILPHHTHAIHLSKLETYEHYKGKGYGTQLFKDICKYYSRIELACVDHWMYHILLSTVKEYPTVQFVCYLDNTCLTEWGVILPTLQNVIFRVV